jgi:hypothetical protein
LSEDANSAAADQSAEALRRIGDNREAMLHSHPFAITTRGRNSPRARGASIAPLKVLGSHIAGYRIDIESGPCRSAWPTAPLRCSMYGMKRNTTPSAARRSMFASLEREALKDAAVSSFCLRHQVA